MNKFVYERPDIRSFGEDESVVRKIIFELDDEATVEDMLDSFTLFLKACRYVVPCGEAVRFVCQECEKEECGCEQRV